MWMSHVECEKSWHIRMRHGTYEFVTSHSCVPPREQSAGRFYRNKKKERFMSHMNESCGMWISRVTCECVMSHMNALHHTRAYRLENSKRGGFIATKKKEKIHVAYEWVASSHAKSHVTCGLVMSHMNAGLFPPNSKITSLVTLLWTGYD